MMSFPETASCARDARTTMDHRLLWCGQLWRGRPARDPERLNSDVLAQAGVI
jgi:hypothetical protein